MKYIVSATPKGDDKPSYFVLTPISEATMNAYLLTKFLVESNHNSLQFQFDIKRVVENGMRATECNILNGKFGMFHFGSVFYQHSGPAFQITQASDDEIRYLERNGEDTRVLQDFTEDLLLLEEIGFIDYYNNKTKKIKGESDKSLNSLSLSSAPTPAISRDFIAEFIKTGLTTEVLMEHGSSRIDTILRTFSFAKVNSYDDLITFSLFDRRYAGTTTDFNVPLKTPRAELSIGIDQTAKELLSLKMVEFLRSLA